MPDKREDQEIALEINEDELLEAVSNAVEDATPGDNDGGETDNTNDEPVADDEPAGQSDDSDDESRPDDDAGDEEDEPGRETSDEEAAADDGEAGKDKPGDKSADDGKTDSGAASDEGADDSDPINDPIPEGVNEKTQQRIQSLIGIAKERTAEAEQGQQIVAAVSEAGADPDQFANTVGFLRLFNSGNTDDRRKALEVARGVVRELALDLGEGTDVVDITQHNDLVAEIEQGTLTEERAREIAANRERQKLVDARQQQSRDREQRQHQTTENVRLGQQKLNEFEASVRAVDSATYERVRPHFVQVLKPILARTHPSEWDQVARDTYEGIKSMAPAAPQPELPKAPDPDKQPLRPKGHGGGGNNKQSEPKSAYDAVNRALSGM